MLVNDDASASLQSEQNRCSVEQVGGVSGDIWATSGALVGVFYVHLQLLDAFDRRCHNCCFCLLTIPRSGHYKKGFAGSGSEESDRFDFDHLLSGVCVR